MAPPIPAQSSTRTMLLQALKTWAPLLAAMGGTAPASRIVDLVGQLQVPAVPPFILIRYEGSGRPADNAVLVGTWAIECHDRPIRGTDAIDRMLDEIYFRFDHARWEQPSSGRLRPLRSRWAGTSGELPDDGYKTIKRIGRIHLYHI